MACLESVTGQDHEHNSFKSRLSCQKAWNILRICGLALPML